MVPNHGRAAAFVKYVLFGSIWMLRQTFLGSNFPRHLTSFDTSRIDVYKLLLRKRASDHSPLKSRLSLLSCIEERGIRVFIPSTEAHQYLRDWFNCLISFVVFSLNKNSLYKQSINCMDPLKKGPCSWEGLLKSSNQQLPCCSSRAHSHHLLARLNLQSRWIQLHRRTDLLGEIEWPTNFWKRYPQETAHIFLLLRVQYYWNSVDTLMFEFAIQWSSHPANPFPPIQAVRKPKTSSDCGACQTALSQIGQLILVESSSQKHVVICKGSCFNVEWRSYVTPYNGLQVLSFQNNQMRFTWATFSLKIDLISLTPSSSRVDRCWPHLLCLACLTRARTRWGNNHRQAIGTKRLGCEPKVVVLLLGKVSSR